MLRVPFVDLVPQHAPLRSELVAALTRVVDSGRFILASEVTAFEQKAARYLDVPHAVGVSSGSDALVCALLATGVGGGDEVIVPGFGFFATAEAVLRVGAVPRFADVEPETLNLSPRACERAITARTKAILAVHLYGAPARLDALGKLAQGAKLALIEDAAQAFGARHDEKAVGALGTVGCFSFFPTKPLGGLGDGGLVCTAHPELAERLRRIRAHGAERRHEHVMLGGNYRLDELQAAALRVKLPHLSASLAERARIAKRYDEAFEGIDGLRRLAQGPNSTSAHALYTLRVLDGRRDALKAFLAAAAIDTAIYYRTPLHRQPLVRDACAAVKLPEAERACEEVLSLPLYSGLSREQQGHVIHQVSRFFAQREGRRL